MPALTYAIQLLSALPALIDAGMSIKNLVSDSTAALNKMQAEKRDPSPQEWQNLNDQITALRNQLHAP